MKHLAIPFQHLYFDSLVLHKIQGTHARAQITAVSKSLNTLNYYYINTVQL